MTRPGPDFAGRYAIAYRIAFRLLGDQEAAAALATDALARAGSRTARAGRLVADAALARAQDAATSGHENRFDDERRRLREAVRGLRRRQRSVFVLHVLGGMSTDQAATELGRPTSWVAEQAELAFRTVGATLNSRPHRDRTATLKNGRHPDAPTGADPGSDRPPPELAGY